MSEQRSLRVLVVDDDRDILELLKYNFEKEGFEVKTVFKSQRSFSVAKKFKPDLIVLDVMMPEQNGIELCKALRQDESFTNTYIFFLSARSESYYQQAALNIGADDYIEKLNGVRMLTNKVCAVLKNNFIIRKGVSLLQTEDIVIHKQSKLVYVRDHQVPLSQPEFDILFFMMQNSNKTISLDSLVKILWGSDIYIQESLVEAYIENLQSKIGKQRLQIMAGHQFRLNQHPLRNNA